MVLERYQPEAPHGPIAQRLVHSAHNRAVQGSNPCWSTNIGRWCNGSITVSKTVGWGSSPYRFCHMDVYPSGLRGQVATLLFTGSNPVAFSKYEVVSLMVKPSVVVRILSVRFWYFLPYNLKFFQKVDIIYI